LGQHFGEWFDFGLGGRFRGPVLHPPARNAGFGGRNGGRKMNVTRNGTDLYFSAKFLKLSMIFGVILTSSG
jgi:hypothetical protein